MTTKKKNASRETQTSARTAPEIREPDPVTADCKSGGLRKLEIKTVESMEAALANVRELSKERLAAKQSVSRLMGVARELKELIKVMSVYGC